MKPVPRLELAAASQAAQQAGFKNQAEYRAGWRQVPGLRGTPEHLDGWTSWAAFLGTGYLSLSEASREVQQAGWRTSAAYREHYRSRPGLPSNPHSFYPDWPGWGVFLGTGRARVRRGQPMSIQAAKHTIGPLKLRTKSDYRALARNAPDLPLRPEDAPAFPGWPDFLGGEKVQRLSYEQARDAASRGGWSTVRAYRSGYRDVPGLPSNPELVYPGWTSWQDFLPSRQPKFLSYEEARAEVQRLGIHSFREYARRFQAHPRLPSTPNKAYAQWPGWRVFLGRDAPLGYQQARLAALALGVRGSADYARRYREHPGLPSTPNKAFPEWSGWKAFLRPLGPDETAPPPTNGA